MNYIKLSDIDQLKGKSLLVVAWFAAIFTFVEAIFLYLVGKQESLFVFPSVIIIFIILSIITLGTALCWLILLLGLFGKVSRPASLDLLESNASDFHVKDTKIISLFGLEIGREYVGEWKDIESKGTHKISEGNVPWSFGVFAEKSKDHKDDERRAVKLINLAIWKLVELGLVGVRARKESGSFLLNKFQGKTQLAIYFYRKEKVLDQKIDGLWEKSLFEKLSSTTHESPLNVKSWVIDAFGDSTQLPMRHVLHITEKELVSRGHGSFSGLILKTFEIPKHDLISKESLKSIDEYIKSHDHELSLQITKALKNRVSAD